MALDPRVRDSAGQFSSRTTVTPQALRKAWAANRGGQRGKVIVPSTNTLAKFSDSRSLMHFDAVPGCFTADKIDDVNAIIRGVSVITSGLVARGHDLVVDEKTLSQMQACAESKGQVPVKVDHKSGAGAVCGFLVNFRQEQGKLKADWHLLESHPQKAQILEVARRMPNGVGLSAAFLGPDKPETTADGRKAARCVDLISVDYVTLPAANPDGMFAAKVDTNSHAMNPEEIQNLIDAAVAKAVAPLQEQLAATQAQLEAAQGEDEGPSLEQLANMSDEELAQHGLTPQDIQDALDGLEGGEEGEAEGSVDGTEGEGEAVGAGAPAGAAAGASTGFNTLISRQLVQLSADLKSLKQAKEDEKADTLFDAIEENIAMLAQENDHLRSALRSHTQPATPGVDRNEVRFFSAKKDEGRFENLVQLGIEQDKLPKAKAFEAARKSDPGAYQDYLVRLGVIKAE